MAAAPTAGRLRSASGLIVGRLMVNPLSVSRVISAMHRPESWPASLTYTRLAAFSVELENRVAQVEAEIVAVEPVPGEHLVRVGQRLDQVVHVVPIGHDLPREPIRSGSRLL